MPARVCLVQVIDVNWIRFAPIDPARGYMVEPPPVAQCLEETAAMAQEMLRLMDGRFVFTPHSGIYNRKAFYAGGFLDVYREAIAKGAELAIHLHEEIQYGGQKYGEPGHVTGVVSGLVRDLAGAGIRSVGYRGGYYAYTDDLTPLLEAHGMLTDLSCLPGLDAGARYADWRGVPFTSFYLGRDSHRDVGTGVQRSRVLEIPMGCDGHGTEKRNHLYVEASDLDVLEGIWAAILGRAEESGRPQIIHALFHTSSVAIPALLEKFRRFVDHMARNGAEFVTASEAKRRHDAIVAAGVA